MWVVFVGCFSFGLISEIEMNYLVDGDIFDMFLRVIKRVRNVFVKFLYYNKLV